MKEELQGGLRVTAHETLPSFRQLEKYWNELLEDSYTNTIFLRFEWLLAWWESMSSGRTLYVLAVWDGQRLVAAAPFCIERQVLGVRAIEFIGDGSADLSDVIVRRECNGALDVLLDSLFASSDKWDCFDLKFVPHGMLFFHHLTLRRGFDLRIYFQRWMSSPYVVVDDAWRSRISGKFKYELRRRRRRLGEDCGSVTVQIATESTEVTSALEVFYSLHHHRWVDMKKGVSNFSVPTIRTQYSRLFRSLAEQGYAFIVTLKSADRPIAMAINMIYDGRMYYCKPTFDPEFSKYAPSHLLIEDLLDYCSSHNIVLFDLLRGDEAYKDEWTSEKIDLYRLYACKPSIKGQIAMRWYTGWRDTIRSFPILGERLRKVRWWLRMLKDRLK
jgi:CelD/BcsL family acetyltransferase involved in cellulose biosynthesis